MTTIDTHHIAQQGLGGHLFFTLGIGNRAWINAPGNLINLTTVTETAAATQTPLHKSKHAAILDGQRLLL